MPAQALGSVTASAEELEVFTLTNQARSVERNCGTTFYPPAPALAINDTLASIAVAHSTDMAVRNRDAV
jgi:uncharacterized protein YkwD